MTFIITIATVLQSFTISLGVGSSTLAIINFFVALSDGTIDQSERRLMGVVYTLLRIAMLLILCTYLTITIPMLFGNGWTALSSVTISTGVIILILFLNALLMTKRIMPSSFGPGIQAGTWYTLGTIFALLHAGIAPFATVSYFIMHVGIVAVAVLLVNVVLVELKKRAALGGA